MCCVYACEICTYAPFLSIATKYSTWITVSSSYYNIVHHMHSVSTFNISITCLKKKKKKIMQMVDSLSVQCLDHFSLAQLATFRLGIFVIFFQFDGFLQVSFTTNDYNRSTRKKSEKKTSINVFTCHFHLKSLLCVSWSVPKPVLAAHINS